MNETPSLVEQAERDAIQQETARVNAWLHDPMTLEFLQHIAAAVGRVQDVINNPPGGDERTAQHFRGQKFVLDRIHDGSFLKQFLSERITGIVAHHHAQRVVRESADEANARAGANRRVPRKPDYF